MAIAELEEAIKTLSLGGGLELIVVYAPASSSSKRLARVVPIDRKFGGKLFAECQRALEDMRSRKQRPYDRNANPTSDEVQLIPSENVNADSEILTLLDAASAEAPAGATSLAFKNPKLYAVAFGSGDNRFYFVRKSVKVFSAAKGLVAQWFGDQLVSVDSPTISFSEGFDAFIHPLGVVLIKNNVFEKVFEMREEVVRQVDANVKVFADLVKLDSKSSASLSDACLSYAYLRKRLAAVIDRGTFKMLSLEQFKRKLVEGSIAADEFFDDQHMVISRENVARLLRLINREVYCNPIDGEVLAADGYSNF